MRAYDPPLPFHTSRRYLVVFVFLHLPIPFSLLLISCLPIIPFLQIIAPFVPPFHPTSQECPPNILGSFSSSFLPYITPFYPLPKEDTTQTYLVASAKAEICDEDVLFARQQDVLQLEVAMEHVR